MLDCVKRYRNLIQYSMPAEMYGLQHFAWALLTAARFDTNFSNFTELCVAGGAINYTNSHLLRWSKEFNTGIPASIFCVGASYCWHVWHEFHKFHRSVWCGVFLITRICSCFAGEHNSGFNGDSYHHQDSKFWMGASICSVAIARDLISTNRALSKVFTFPAQTDLLYQTRPFHFRV